MKLTSFIFFPESVVSLGKNVRFAVIFFKEIVTRAHLDLTLGKDPQKYFRGEGNASGFFFFAF